MTPQTLRESIFNRAFEGKLVAQYTEEGTAEDTLKSIKYKAVQSVEDCIDIPETWRWTYLIDMVEILYGFPFNSEKFNEAQVGMPIIRIRDINNGYSRTYSDEPCEERYRIIKGDMLVGMDGNFQVAFWASDDAWLNQRVCKITSNPTVLIQKYLYYYLPIILKEINGTVSYSTVKHLSAKILNQMLIPLPPLAEQKRIVAKIEELLPLIDRYEQAWSKLEDFNKRFPVDMQKSILQMAIQGKLVEQRPEEGTGEELYQQIQEEKQSLIKAGKIKKEKPLPEITEDEIPFDIPDGWVWVRLRNICTKIVDGDHNPPSGIKKCTEYLMLSAQNINQNQLVDLDKVRYLTEEVYCKENERTKVEKGDIFLTTVGTLGRSCVYDSEYNITFQRSVSVISTLAFNRYVKYVFDSPFVQRYIVKNATGTAQKGFYLNQLENLIIPLPPLAEQKRIVAKLEEILPLCERLK